MPYSDSENRQWAHEKVTAAQPGLIYDIGPGVGTYADLLRHRLPNTFFHGIEIWEPYIEQFDLESKYDAITVADVREFPFPHGNYTIVMGDVLEHMPEEDGRAVIARMKEAAQHILLSVPIRHCEQGAVFGNPYEAHVRHWHRHELDELMGHCPSIVGRTLARYWWTRPEGE